HGAGLDVGVVFFLRLFNGLLQFLAKLLTEFVEPPRPHTATTDDEHQTPDQHAHNDLPHVAAFVPALAALGPAAFAVLLGIVVAAVVHLGGLGLGRAAGGDLEQGFALGADALRPALFLTDPEGGLALRARDANHAQAPSGGGSSADSSVGGPPATGPDQR